MYINLSHVNNLKHLEVVHILDLMDWLKYFTSQLDRLGLSDQSCVSVFRALADDVLLREYLDRTEYQISNWFDNIESQEVEIIQDAEGRLVNQCVSQSVCQPVSQSVCMCVGCICIYIFVFVLL